jgi:hypothetical protein
MPAACRKRFSCFLGMLVLELGTLMLKADPVGRGYWTAKEGCMVARETHASSNLWPCLIVLAGDLICMPRLI